MLSSGRLLDELVPSLVAEVGVSTMNAANFVIAAGQNPERLRTEGSFAALCRTSPVEASSGKHQRRRINQGGNRQANSAPHIAVLVRRCIKRALARRFHRLLVNDLSHRTEILSG